jgi:hypothetical protein
VKEMISIARLPSRSSRLPRVSWGRACSQQPDAAVLGYFVRL